MDIQDTLRGIAPLPGHLIPIKTVQEARPPEEFGTAYVAEVNVKSASKVIKALDATFPRDPSNPLTHLRRFAKYPQLPAAARALLVPDGHPSHQTIFVLIPPPLPAPDALQALLAPFAPEPTPPSPTDPPASASHPPPPPPLHSIPVPLQPPLTPAQATKWSQTLWPVVYNPAAPRATIAPPPQILARAHASLKPTAGRYLALARRVAREAAESGRGRGVGAVVVDPAIEARLQQAEAGARSSSSSSGDGRGAWDAVVAVAGDARYARRREGGPLSTTTPRGNAAPPPYEADREGGPELHALMRATELIASQRRGDAVDGLRVSPLEGYFLGLTDGTAEGEGERAEEEEEGQEVPPPPEKYQKNEEGRPVEARREETETAPPRIRARSDGGYLCTDLDVYVSREPCVCCSMGMLLSRFRAVVFPRNGRMVTGGLASAPVVVPVAEDDSEAVEEAGQPERTYYGLHWRKELNWRALGFEFIEGEGNGEGEGERAYDEVAYHA
ncbi:hypothetical protein BDV59DRAFT_197246 [Aspergillus ambiguus]|uniref:putative tRNA-specific adenosine-34 deaminase subunit Tad3 n=1 Tax=Aspergillus ambiguus TaxID=176160 RepID=UPI003CCD4459